MSESYRYIQIESVAKPTMREEFTPLYSSSSPIDGPIEVFSEKKRGGKVPGLEVIHYKGSAVERTLGRIGSIPSHLVMLTPSSIIKSAPEEFEVQLKDRFKDVPWQGNVEVYLNHSPFIRQAKRLFSKDRRTNLFLRSTLGVAQTTGGWLYGKLTRTDLYNPWTETAQVYDDHISVAAHEIGHAMDFDQYKYPGLRMLGYAIVPGLTSKLEWNASHNAMKHLKEEERSEARKILEPALGSYLGFELFRISKLLGKPLPFLQLGILAGIAAGHIHARTSEKNIFLSDKVAKENPSTSPLPAFA